MTKVSPPVPAALRDLEALLSPALVPGGTADAALMRRSIAAQLFHSTPPAPKIGRYNLQRRVGAGGMGVVFEALDATLRRPVAVKLLPPGQGEKGRVAAARMVREAQALARLTHPNVVEVFEVGRHREQVFIAMEFIRGHTLRQWVTQTRPSTPRIIEVYRQFARGLDAIHGAGLVHRDVKPSNVLIDEEGRVRIIDFGLAAQTGTNTTVEASQRGNAVESSVSTEVLTRTGAVLGTLAYLAPEQRVGNPASARSDQYAYCLSLFEALTGRLPSKRSAAAPSRDDLADCPRGVRRVLARGLAFDPERRWPSMAQLASRLGGRRIGLPLATGGGASVALVVALGMTAASQRPTCAEPSPEIDGVWDASSRDQLGAALGNLPLPHAEDLSGRIVQRLDAYALSWQQVRAEACGDDDGSALSLDEVMQCLAPSRAAMQVVIDSAAQLRASEAFRIDDAIASLPDPARCRTADAELMARSPTERDGITVARARLQTAMALSDLGQLEEASTMLEEVRHSSAQLDYAPLRVEADYASGLVYRLQGETSDATAAFERALWAAVSAGLDEHIPNASSQLAVTLAIAGDFEQSQRQIRLASAAIERSGAEPAAQAVVDSARGTVARYQGRLLEAREHFEAAAKASRNGGDRTSELEHLDDLAAAESGLGHHDVALALWHETYEAKREQLGPDHPSLLRNRLHRGIGHWQAGEPERAATLLEGVVDDAARILGEHSELVAAGSLNLAAVKGTTGRHAEALAHVQRGQAAYQAILSEDHPQLVLVLTSLGAAQDANGSPEAARDAFEEAVRISRLHGNEGAHLASVLINLAALDRKLGHPSDAVRRAREAHGMLEQHTEPGHPERARALWVTGSAQADLGNTAEAIETLQHALDAAPPEGRAGKDLTAKIGRALDRLREAPAPR